MKVERPGLALWIYFGIGLVLWMYGVRDGSLLVFCALAGLFIYKITPHR